MISKVQEENTILQTKELVYAFYKLNLPNSSLLLDDELLSVRSNELDNKILSLSDGSDIGLSKLGISSSTIQRRLTNKEKILLSFPKNGLRITRELEETREKNKLNGRSRGGINSQIKYGSRKDSKGRFLGSGTKYRLDIFGLTKDEEMMVLSDIIMYFRIKPYLIKYMFPYKEEDIMNYLNKYCGKDATEYLLIYDKYNQDLAHGEFLNFYNKLLEAKNNKLELSKLFESISNKKILDLRKNNISDFSLDDIYNILKFQIKYSISNEKIFKLFMINEDNYLKNINIIFSNDPILKMQYDNLITYYEGKKYGSRSK